MSSFKKTTKKFGLEVKAYGCMCNAKLQTLNDICLEVSLVVWVVTNVSSKLPVWPGD